MAALYSYSDVIIYSSRVDWSGQAREWCESLRSVRHCHLSQVLTGGEPHSFLTHDVPLLFCFDARQEDCEGLRDWSEATLRRMRGVVVTSTQFAKRWRSWCEHYEFDLLNEDEWAAGVLALLVAQHIRLWRLERRLAETGEFLSNMSHEVRTPLNTVVGMADLLQNAHSKEVEKKHLDVIKRSSQSLLSLIHNMLDLTHLEFGRWSYESILFNVHEMLETTFEQTALRAHKKGLEAILDIERSVSLYVRSDRDRLQQILVNLLSNAVQFTEQGQIVMRVWNSLDMGEPHLHCAVSDTGTGMSEAQLSRVFADFSVTEKPLLRTQVGPGLGLRLTRKFIEGLGGRLEAESALNQGSTFQFSIPIEVVRKQPSPELVSRDLAQLCGRRVLLLDLHDESTRVTERYLHELGFAVESHSHPNEFLTRLQRPRAGYDMALIDYETAGAQLSAWLSQTQVIPPGTEVVVMLKSNHRMWSRISRGKNALGVRHLFKPLKRRELLTVVHELFFHESESKREPSIKLLPRARANEDFRILVVDDSKDNRYLMRAYLRDSYHATWFAEDGRAAVEMACAQRYDLIFMDLQMPEMDGITATRLIREHEQKSGWPRMAIFALTAHVLPEEKAQALAGGCDDYLMKPVTKQNILETIERVRGEGLGYEDSQSVPLNL